jgi:hypothetical protein
MDVSPGSALLPAALIPLESAKRRMGVFQRYDITAGRGSALVKNDDC